MKKKTIRIGFQGIKGSNSEKAAEKLAENGHIGENAAIEYVPLVDSESVVEALYRDTIDYGVIATCNSTAGEVRESMEALKKWQPEFVGVVILPINHALFKKEESAEILYIASHPQALKQCANYLKTHFPTAKQVEIEDTAIGAERLAYGEYDSSTAIICPLAAGLDRGLFLVQNNIADNKNNRTEFRMFKKPSKRFIHKQKLSTPMISSEIVREKSIQVFLVALILLSTWLITTFKMSAWGTAFSISGYVLSLYFVVKAIKRFVFTHSFVGYWKYYSIAGADEDLSQAHQLPRLVELIEDHGKYVMSIYTPSKGKSVISAKSKSVHIVSDDSCSGQLIYEYSTDEAGINVSGITILDWRKAGPLAIVKEMRGRYFGFKSKEIGHLVFKRISKEEFNRIKVSTFLNCPAG